VPFLTLRLKTTAARGRLKTARKQVNLCPSQLICISPEGIE
jgi:hypothetical protein